MVDETRSELPIDYTPYEAKYMETVNSLTETFLRKNADYGSSVKKNYDKLEKYGPNEGLKYVFGRISEKYDRLENLIYGNHENKVVDESIADTLLDMANYAILASVSFNEHHSKPQEMPEAIKRLINLAGMEYKENDELTKKPFYGD